MPPEDRPLNDQGLFEDIEKLLKGEAAKPAGGCPSTETNPYNASAHALAQYRDALRAHGFSDMVAIAFLVHMSQEMAAYIWRRIAQ